MVRLLAYVLEIVVLLLVLRRVVGAVLGLLGQPQVRVWTSRSGSAEGGAKKVVEGQAARDPVCGIFISTELSERLTLDGRTLHFCSRDCLERYQKTHA